MNAYNKNNFQDDIGRGQIERYGKLTKFGRGITDNEPTSVTTISTTSKQLYVYPDFAAAGTAVKMNLVSSSASDTAQVVKIFGLDKNWKLQDEEITTNGTTDVESALEYLRIFRMRIVTGPINVGTITLESLNGAETHAEIDFDATGKGQGQTEMAVYTVADGYQLIINGVDGSTYEADKTNLIMAKRDMSLGNAPFLTKFNWMLYRNNVSIRFPIADTSCGKTDIEMRSYNVGGVGEISAMFYGYLEQLNSVPIDLSNFALTAGNGEIEVVWDEQTVAETQDMKYFEVRLYIGNDLIETFQLAEKDATGISITNLVNDTEYTVEVNWVGYDNKKGTTVTDDVTPIVPVPSTGYVLGSGWDPISGVTDGIYFLSDDAGATWSSETLAATGYDVVDVVVVDDFSLMIVEDPDEMLDSKLMESTNGSTWSIVSAYTPNGIQKMGDRILRTNSADAITSSSDNSTWTAVTGITSLTGSGTSCKMDSNYYIVDDESSVDKSTDGYTFTPMTNQPSSLGNISCSSTRLMTAYISGIDTTVSYEYADGDVAWANGGTSSITATEIGVVMTVFFDGKFHTITYETDQSAGYYETSTDGTTWVDVSSNLPADQLPLGIATDGTNLYISLADSSTFAGSVMAYNGTTYATPVAYNEGSVISLKLSGK